MSHAPKITIFPFGHNLQNSGQQTVPRIHPKALELLESHHWHGNLRELRNALERGVTLCTNNSITIDDLPEDLFTRSENVKETHDAPAHAHTDVSQRADVSQMTDRTTSSSGTPPTTEMFYSRCMLPQGLSKLARVRLQAEVNYILQVLERQNNNRQQTARELGISRVALYKKLHKYGLIESR